MIEQRRKPYKHIALFLLLALLLAGGCESGLPQSDRLASEMESNLSKIMTVQGRIDLTIGELQLEQELWLQPPKFMRAEIDVGPPGFAGTIQVLNEEEGWLYSRALDMATVVDRSDYTPDMGAVAGSSLLETLAADVLAALQANSAVNVVGQEEVAGRDTYHVEVVLKEAVGALSPGTLNVWLDRKFYYPLAIATGQGLAMRFQFVKFNEEIDPLTFIFIPPPGARVSRAQR